MLEINTLLNSINSRLLSNDQLPHQASTIAYDLFLLKSKFGQTTYFQDHDLVSTFIEKLNIWELEDLMMIQVNYAMRIANSDGNLEYEEINKLFSLCDEIHALHYLGLDIDCNLKVKYEESIQYRFDKENIKAKMVAKKRVEHWKQDFWWYKTNLD